MEQKTTLKQKLSERIAAVGAEFINSGNTLEDKHNRLTAVCSAWNMASGSPDNRRYQLDQYFQSFQKLSPEFTAADIALMRKDMESLIARKLKMFKDDHRQIVGAKVVPVATGYRIEVASAAL